jgi:zinc protease
MRADAIALDNPLMRFSGKTAPDGGIAAVRDVVTAALREPVAPPEDGDVAEFAYTDFGEPGAIVADERIPDLGIRTLRFTNGVMLNLKPTDLSDDRVMVRLTLDGGKLLESRAEPLAVERAKLRRNSPDSSSPPSMLRASWSSSSIKRTWCSLGATFQRSTR